MSSKLQLYVIKFFFKAFLPRESQQFSYYEALGITKNATPDDIRQAFRKKSLQYHPDKVAQRRRQQQQRQDGSNSDSNLHNEYDIESNFVKIKEAYETLSDQERKNAYDVLGAAGGKMYCSIAGSGDSFDLSSLVYNLARASFFDKSKLFLMVFIAVMLMLLGPILICAKIDTNAAVASTGWGANWVAVLIPIWIINLIAMIFALFGRSWFAVLRMSCVFSLEILLALKWDNLYVGDLGYEYLLIPLYIHQALILLGGIALFWRMKIDIRRMVTISHLERHILPSFRADEQSNNGEDEEKDNADHPTQSGLSYENLTDEERDMIDKLYIIVTEIPKEDSPFGDSDDESLTSIQADLKAMYSIADSPEYALASQLRLQALRRIISVLLFRTPFIILLVLQLQGAQSYSWRMNWNTVFSPLWVEVLLNTCVACASFCALGMTDKKSLPEEDEMEIIEIDGSVDSNQDRSVENHEDVEKGQESEKLLGHEDPKMTGKSSSLPESQRLNMDGAATQTSSTPVEVNVDADEENSDTSDSNFDFDSESAGKTIKALGGCCYYLLIVVVLTLFLVKLNRATEIEGGVNYSSFWLMFPLFTIAVLILFLFGCCIFASSENFANQEGERSEEATNPTNENPGSMNVGLEDRHAKDKSEPISDVDEILVGQKAGYPDSRGSNNVQLSLDRKNGANEAVGTVRNSPDAAEPCMEDLD